MTRYYWYINKDPTKYTGGFYLRDEHYIRSTTIPPPGYYYIMETVNGYKHELKDSEGKFTRVENTSGSLVELRNIHNAITHMLKFKFDEKLLDEQEKLRKLTDEKSKSGRVFPEEDWSASLRHILPSEYSTIEIASRHRKNRLKSRLNRKPISKKHKIIKKVRK